MEADLYRLELCRNRLREVEIIKRELHQNLDKILEALKNEAKVSIEDYFVEEDYERGNLVQKVDMKARQFF